MVSSYLKVTRVSTDRSYLKGFFKSFFRFLGLDRFSLFERELCSLTQNPLRIWEVTQFHQWTRNRFLEKTELFERFLKVVFRFSGSDRLSFFGRILLLDTESAETLGGDAFSPFDTESDYKI